MNDHKAVSEAAEAFAASVNQMIRDGQAGEIPEDVLQKVFTAAVKAYAARVEILDREPAIIDTRVVSATEGVTAACALIRAVDLNMFDVTLWYNRSGPNRPG